MDRTASLAIACLFPLAACAAAGPDGRAVPTAPSLHVGIQPRDLVVGRVENDFECHVGQRGFPDVKTWDSHVVEGPNGIITLTCHGQLPAGTEPSTAIVETGLLCFLPESRSTRDAREVFTPSGAIKLTCHFRA